MNRIIPTVALIILALFACDKDRKFDSDTDVALKADSIAIREVLSSYTQSIDNADSVLGSKLFSHSPEVSFIHPRGHEKGWPQIEESIYKFFGDTFSSRDLKASAIKITVYGDTAWLEFYWVFDATFKQDNSPLQTKGRETQILRKSDGVWKIVHVHYSGMPVAAQGEGF